MASTSETGHAKNVSNFQNLIAFAKGYGNAYNPSKNALKITQLETLFTDAETKIAEVVSQNAVYNTKISERQNAFLGLKSLSTRLVNALQITEATDQVINDAKGFNRKLQGQRVSPVPTASTDANTAAPNTISTSQQSYTQQLQHFAGLVAVLKNEPSYAPNEEELKVATLETMQEDLSTKNDAVNTAFVEVSNARLARNATLYTNDDSIFETAAEIKMYIKAIYGATSPEFAQIKGIEFKKPKV